MNNCGNLADLGLFWTYLATYFGVSQTTLDTFNRRLKSEGINFLTKTLPALGKDLDKVLISGDRFVLTARFRKHAATELPDFLYDTFHRILSNDGNLRTDASPHHIKIGRQLTLMFYKLEVQYEEDTLEAAYAAFRDRDTALFTTPIDVGVPKELINRARYQLSRVLSSKENSPGKLVPRHGPGATACRSRPWDKYHKAPRFIHRLNSVYDYSETFFFSPTHLCDELEKLTLSAELDEPVSRISAVPKDSRGPRLICMEPREMQYVQQGLMRRLYDIVEKHPLTAGFVNFTDQQINKDLAKLASIDGKLATLDLKDASDRVRWDLIQVLFPPKWVRALDACRTRYVEFPNGYTFGPLGKFAPMGSAVCFPVEALTFWALLKANLHTDVYVYGDDILLPTELVNQATAILESVDLKVNLEKSCYKTPFRESCGGDYFKGYDVGYVKYRRVVEDTISSHLSFVGFVNEIIENFGECAAYKLMSYGDTKFGIHIRTLSDLTLSYRCSLSSCNSVFFKRRWNRNLQKYELRVPIVTSRVRRYRANPKYHWCELLRKTLTMDTEMRVGEYADGTCIVKEAWRGDL